MDNESIAQMVQKWLAGSGDVLSIDELLERIKGREQWIANEIGWRDRLNYQQLEMLQKAEAENADLRRQLAEAQADKQVLRAQLAQVEHFAVDCWRAGAYCTPFPQWEDWIATRK